MYLNKRMWTRAESRCTNSIRGLATVPGESIVKKDS
jgi:hypothetical protein